MRICLKHKTFVSLLMEVPPCEDNDFEWAEPENTCCFIDDAEVVSSNEDLPDFGDISGIKELDEEEAGTLWLSVEEVAKLRRYHNSLHYRSKATPLEQADAKHG